MKIVAAVLAGGSGARFGEDKTLALLHGQPLWRWSFDALRRHPLVTEVLLVGNPNNIQELAGASRAILGGGSRQESSRAAVEATPDADILLIHDAARPFVSEGLITRVIDAVVKFGAAAPAIPVTDTIRQNRDGRAKLLDRSTLIAMQTPQGARRPLLERAHLIGALEATDDMALIEALGLKPEIIPGDPENFKVTTPSDLARARALMGGGEIRTGFGYDVHGFSDDPERSLFLGGVKFELHRALDGHSDADVLLHAITDALLGACALGDIGQHFPNTEPRWSGEPSLTFLVHAAALVRGAGWEIMNVDSTVIAETPKIMPRCLEMRDAIAKGIGCTLDRVSVKATTNERLGSIGRDEGIAAYAVATLRRI